MFYAVLGLIVLASIGSALYALINKSELVAQIATLQNAIEEQDASYSAEVGNLNDELSKLNKIRHIPHIIETARSLESEIAAKLVKAQTEADETVLLAHKEVERMKARLAASENEARQRASEIVQEADSLKQRIISEAEKDLDDAKEIHRVAEWQIANLIEEAQKQATQITSQARREAKEKSWKMEEALARATTYALDIREKAEARAKEIGGQAYEALKRHKFYEDAATAMEDVVSGYGKTYLVPASHLLDELAEEYGFHKAAALSQN